MTTEIARLPFRYYKNSGMVVSLKFMKEVARKCVTVFLYLLRIFPVKRNRILIASFGGKSFSDNSKYLYLELAKRGGYEFIWVVTRGTDIASFPSGVKTVRINSLWYFYYLATAKVWIDNIRKDYYIRKRKSQYYVQVWHGSIALKKVELDAKEALSSYYLRRLAQDSQMADLMVSNGKFCTEWYRRAFAHKGEILEAGTPKLDFLLNCAEMERKRLKSAIGLPESARVVLYAPTFRVNWSLKPYQMDYERLRRALTEKFGGDWHILVRLHPNMQIRMSPVRLDCVQDVTDYADIYELLCFADLLITDYSSTMFEMAVARKPVVLYATDIEEYKKDRNFYFSLDSLPFPIAQSNEELERVIWNYNRDESVAAADAFLKKLDVHETGHASELVADVIERVIRGEKQ